MSCRVSYIIMDKNKNYKCYYSKFGGSGVYSIITETEEIINIVKSFCEEEEYTPRPFEGGAFLDFSCNELLFFGHCVDLPISVIKRIYIPYIQNKWGNWKISYSDWGIEEFENRISKNYSKVYSKLRKDEISKIDYIEKNIDKLKEKEVKELSTQENLITIRFKEGLVRNYITSLYDFNFFYLVQALGNVKNLISFFWDLEPVEMPNEINVQEGAYIDYVKKHVYYWDNYSDLFWDYNSFLNNFCKDWKIIQHFDGLPYHAELSGRKKESVFVKREDLINIFSEYFKDNFSFDINDLMKYDN